MIDSLLIVQPQYHALFGIRFHAKFLGSCLNMEEEDSIDELIYKVCRLISYNVGKGIKTFIQYGEANLTLAKKYAYTKKSTILTQSLWNLAGYFGQVS